MDRQLPIFEIKGTAFFVDVQKGELRQRDNPENTISFNDMQYHKDHYKLRYDLSLKKLPDLFRSNETNITEIHIPHMSTLDPEGMAEKYGLPIHEVKQKPDIDFLVDKQWLTQRLQGKLPIINIAGTDFIVDVRLKELREENDFSVRIDLRKLDMTDDGTHYICFYQAGTKQVVEIDSKLTELPKDVVMLKIPDELKLDPIAVAREYGIDEIDFVRSHPPEKNLQATIVPLTETSLPELAERNKKELKNKPDNITKNSNRKNRGNRM